ncbi:PD-(D/E)XK nuclease family protein [Candidatus Poriferisocius sp.]|uniref:PD-(D/E)XK nuclease family protein n=1 Tax=Candidatus Poriferisocius sp. TaxID=3101276 RepID=UPI003B02E387
MLRLEASRAGEILACARRAQWLIRNRPVRDPVMTAAQLVGEFTHRRWLYDPPAEAFAAAPGGRPVRWDKVTPDLRTAVRQSERCARLAEDLLDHVSGGAPKRVEEQTEHPLEWPVAAGELEVRARADLTWRNGERRLCVAELKTGKQRPADVMQLAMTAAAAGEADVTGWLLYVPRDGSVPVAKRYDAEEMEVIVESLAQAWFGLHHPVPSWQCETCPVETCRAGRAEEFRLPPETYTP